jgi:hypothetical protein
MKKDVLNWLVLSIVVVTAGYNLYIKYQEAHPCAQPVHYAVGSVDKRFDITNAALIEDLKTAAAIWNKAAGKTVLVYDPAAPMKINLIYDEREANAKLGVQITARQTEQDNERATLDALQSQFATDQAAYNQEVQTINARGGATKSEAVRLNNQRAALGVLADSINHQIAVFNASVAALNAVVEEYNKTAGHTFEEGQYVRDAQGQRINIFEFIGTLQLERVLAHEFGHAIGLGHNDDPKSIMYAKNESGNLVPTTSDLAALKTVCG